MTRSPDNPDSRENLAGAPQTGSPHTYPNQYQYGPYAVGYPPPPPYYGYPPAPVAPKNGLGVASLVLGVIALVSVATVFAPIVLGPLAVVIGFLGHRRVKRGATSRLRKNRPTVSGASMACRSSAPCRRTTRSSEEPPRLSNVSLERGCATAPARQSAAGWVRSAPAVSRQARRSPRRLARSRR